MSPAGEGVGAVDSELFAEDGRAAIPTSGAGGVFGSVIVLTIVGAKEVAACGGDAIVLMRAPAQEAVGPVEVAAEAGADAAAKAFFLTLLLFLSDVFLCAYKKVSSQFEINRIIQ